MVKIPECIADARGLVECRNAYGKWQLPASVESASGSLGPLPNAALPSSAGVRLLRDSEDGIGIDIQHGRVSMTRRSAPTDHCLAVRYR